jgi:AraC-like DNA-binding protein
MSRPTFYENFRAVMHISPLQYAKAVKLQRAQVLIQEGKRANEAGYLVGYNSPAQFSREYKRYFGYAPSAT